MFQFTLRRIVQLLPVLFGISLLSFLMLHLIPGDAALLYAGDTPLGDELVAQIRKNLGLDRPLYVQYGTYVFRAVQGDLGTSMRHHGSVSEAIAAVLPHTLQLTLGAMLVSILVGPLLGILAAIRQGTWIDLGSMTVAMVGVTFPTFFSGLLLIIVFSFRFGWFPATGAGGIERLVLPSLALGLSSAAILARLVRSSMLEVLQQDYIVTARSKGLLGSRVVLGHALKNALIPAITVVGLQVGHLMAGAVTTEIVFSRPGVGRLLIISIGNRDYTMAQGIILFAAVGFVIVNLVVDLIYGVIDPRIRYD